MKSCLRTLCYVLIALSCWAPSAALAEWETSEDQAKVTKLGKFWGRLLKVELRTRPSTITSSFVRVKVMWHNRAQKTDEEQVIIDDERASQFDRYSFSYDRPNTTIYVSYHCPKDRKDKATMCKEKWMYHKAKNQWVLKETTSSNPTTKKRGEILALIKANKQRKAVAGINALLKQDPDTPTDVFFEAFFKNMHDRAWGAFKKKRYDEAFKIVEGFRAKPPVASTQSCPPKSDLYVCLKGNDSCGCSDAFGVLAATEKNAKRMEHIAKIWAKQSKWKRIIAVLAPMAEQMPDNPDLALYLADAYWEIDFKTKARVHYRVVRAVRLAERAFMPPRVLERFKAK